MIAHLQHSTRTVKLGGRKLGPLSLGGRWYTVGPLSVSRWIHFLAVCERMGEAGIQPLTGTPDPEVTRILAPLFVLEAVRPADLARATAQQLTALWFGLAATNDLAYLLRSLVPSEGKGEKVGLELVAVSVGKAFGIRPSEIVRTWSYEELLEVQDQLDELARRADPDAEDEPREMTEAEVEEYERKLAAFGYRLGADGTPEPIDGETS